MTKLYMDTKELCKEHKMSIRALQRELNFPDGTISNWAYRLPNCSKVIDVAQYFNVSIDFLLGISNIRYPFKQDVEGAVKDILEAAIRYNIDKETSRVVIDLMRSLTKHSE